MVVVLAKEDGPWETGTVRRSSSVFVSGLPVGVADAVSADPSFVVSVLFSFVAVVGSDEGLYFDVRGFPFPFVFGLPTVVSSGSLPPIVVVIVTSGNVVGGTVVFEDVRTSPESVVPAPVVAVVGVPSVMGSMDTSGSTGFTAPFVGFGPFVPSVAPTQSYNKLAHFSFTLKQFILT